MAPSAALQSRIKAFEDLQNTSSSSSSSSSPPPALNATRKSSPLNAHVTANPTTIPKPAQQPMFNDLDLLDSEPVSPSSADPLNTIKPLVPVSVSRSPSPAALGRKSSLIHFSELAGSNTGGSNGSAGSGNSSGLNGMGNGNGVKSNMTGSTTSSTSEVMLGLGGISGGMGLGGRRVPQLPPRPGSTVPANLNPHSNTSTPPLPPRKPSLGSLRIPSSSSSSTPPPLPRRNGSAPTSSTTSLNQPQLKPPSRTPTNLLAPTPHTYPPTLTSPGGSKIRHVPSGSTSSFHSVSLSSDGGDTREDSLDGSYETVSSTVATSPVSSLNSWEQDTTVFNAPNLNSNGKPWPWQKGMGTSTPPVLVSSPTGTSIKSQGSINTLVSKRPPPPPPQRKSPPSSTTSTAVSSPTTPHASIIKPISRPVPIPPASKVRYDALFERNLRIHCTPQPQIRKRSSQSGGWRGPSLDLTSPTKTQPLSGTNTSPNEDRLPAAVIKHIWKASKLPRDRLRDIWNECDPDGVGSLDKEAFGRGMWRIDEALRVAQLARTKKSPPRPPPQKQQQQPQAYASHAVAYTPRVPLRRTNLIKA